MPAKSNDIDVRIAITGHLLNAGIPRSDIRHELTLDTWSSGGRADMVVLHSDRLCGIEIKSAKDVLDRAEDQIRNYQHAFDAAVLVADIAHRNDKTPWSGNIFFDPTTRQFIRWSTPLQISIVHEAMQWCSSNRTSPAYMASLLWRDEAVVIVQKLGASEGTRFRALEWIRENATLKQLRPLVISALRQRVLSAWEEAFWRKFDAAQTAETIAA